MKALLASLVLASAVSACTAPGATGGVSPLVADRSLMLTANTSVAFSTLATAAVAGAAIYLVYDPLAPNWEISESALADDTYRFSLTMKRYHTGGAGESIQVFKRRAAQLQYERGYASYQIIEYTEGIESQTLGARRKAEGVIRLVQRQQADSFLQGEAY